MSLVDSDRRFIDNISTKTVSLIAGGACFFGGLGMYAQSYLYTPEKEALVLESNRQEKIDQIRKLAAIPQSERSIEIRDRTDVLLVEIGQIEQEPPFVREMIRTSGLEQKKLEGELLMIAGGAIILGTLDKKRE